MNIQQGKVRIDEKGNPKFNSDFKRTVKFAKPFQGTPSILTSITHLETTSFVRKFPYEVLDKGGCYDGTEYLDSVIRYDCTVEDATSTEFTIHIHTWEQNIIYSVDVAWIAIGEE